MIALIRASLGNPYAVVVAMLTVVVLGVMSLMRIPMDILPVFSSPAVQVLTFYGGMPATTVEKDITMRMERQTGQAAGTIRQESRSIVGASIVRNYYRDGVDPNGALTQVNSLATAAIPSLPPGTLPPVILPFDPTGTVPICLIALDSETQTEEILYDVARYEVRNMVLALAGAVAPVVYGGKLCAVLAYVDRDRLQARGLSPLDVMKALDNYNLFLPTGDVCFGNTDFALDSNSMVDVIERMGDIPIHAENGNAVFLRDVAKPKDASLVQTSVVRVNGRRQVYVPVFRQQGASTLAVVEALQAALPDIEAKLSRPGIHLKLVMDQSVYVRHSIHSLVEEGVLGAVLCSLVILLFLGDFRLTIIAAMTIPVSVFAAGLALYATGNTINVMTLAGLALAIGPLVDLAIVCLENTHRHLGEGKSPADAAFLGASEVALPALVACLSTLLVLAPLALIPGLGAFLFKPLVLSVAFAMMAAYVLSLTFVPTRCAAWLKAHVHKEHEPNSSDGHEAPKGLFARWEAFLQRMINVYVAILNVALRIRWLVVAGAAGLLVAAVAVFTPILRREFFPEVDAGAFEIYVRAPTGTRLEVTESRIALVEQTIRKEIGRDLSVIVCEIGAVPDWSAAYTVNAGPMDGVVKVQLAEEREHSAQEYVEILRRAFTRERQFADLEFAFDAGGMVRSAMNEGKSTPINVRITGKDLAKSRGIAEAIQKELQIISGVVDCRIMQRLDYPQYILNVDRTTAADLGLTQEDVIKNVVAAFNSSIQFNKKNFWIDPVNSNQYYVGVSYPSRDIVSLETLLDVPITGPGQKTPIPLRSLVKLKRTTVPAELVHASLQSTIDLTMGVSGRDLGHVADDVARVVARYGEPKGNSAWTPYAIGTKEPIKGSLITLAGEYQKMQETFTALGGGLVLAIMLVYFLMVALFRSYVTPIVVLSAVPVGIVGVLLVLYVTGTAINVQSLLGVVFMVGIVVSNTVLLVDFALRLAAERRMTALESIREAAAVRVRPIVMTALAAFFALLPMALGLARGSEANTPLGRAVLGGLVAGLITTLFVVPCIYVMVFGGRNNSGPADAKDQDDRPPGLESLESRQ